MGKNTITAPEEIPIDLKWGDASRGKIMYLQER